MDADDDKYGKSRSRFPITRILAFVGVLLCFGLILMVVEESSTVKTAPTPDAVLPDSPATIPRHNEAPATPSITELETAYQALDAQVRTLKQKVPIMETDEESLRVTSELQEAARQLILAKYGNHEHYRVRVQLEFPETVPDYAERGSVGELVIEMAPLEYIPVSVWTFLEIARSWRSGEFHRNAGHVLQATTHASAITKHLPFQEYSEHFPHAQYTCGYCGRPSGPCWYISIKDNTRNHGPGSQQQKNPYEADANFGRLVSGMDDVVPRIHSIPQNGWLDKKNQVKIVTMTVLVPTGPEGEFEPWKAGNGGVTAVQ